MTAEPVAVSFDLQMSPGGAESNILVRVAFVNA
jgi:hypothetical protein